MCCCLLQWIRRLWPQRPPNDDQLRRQLAQVRELDKQHREAFEHLLRMFEWEVADRKDGYYETGLDIPYDGQPQEKDKDNRT